MKDDLVEQLLDWRDWLFEMTIHVTKTVILTIFLETRKI